MASAKKVAVVTGSNKGIGYAIVRGLCRQFEGDVILTARDEGRGLESQKALEGEGLKAMFHQLDIDNQSSIEGLRRFLEQRYGGLDVLVNNAGIAYKRDSPAPFSEQAEVTVKTNFFGTLNVCRQLFPLLRPHARVVNVSSIVSQFAISKCSKVLQDRFKDPALTMSQLEDLMNEFVSQTKAGKLKEGGWPDTAYGVSKVGVTVMTMLQQRQIDDSKMDDVIVNCCCPGYVSTDMSSHKGTKNIDQGAETPLMLALVPPNSDFPKGKYFSDEALQTWG